MIKIEELAKKDSKVICLGNHPGIIQSMLDFDYLSGKEAPSVLGLVSRGRRVVRFFWGEEQIELPVFESVESIPASLKAELNTVITVQSARRVLSGVAEVLSAVSGVDLVVIFAEGVPEKHSIELSKIATKHNALVVGPASVGLLIPGVLKIGAIGGTQAQQITQAKILQRGDTAVISTSGGMVNELINSVTKSGLRLSFAVALGGDRYPVLSPAEAFLLAQQDPNTNRVVYFGELGGDDEYKIVELIKSGKYTKDLIAYVAGEVAELFETPPQFGHAKAMAVTVDESAKAKRQALKNSSNKAVVLESFSELEPSLAQCAEGTEVIEEEAESKTIGPRSNKLISSHVSGVKDGKTYLLGREMLETVDEHSYASLVLSMLLQQDVKSEKITEFTDYVLKLLVDHGPYVSGAINTIVSARAGKDMVSSLASGLLTVGPRFGGAVNDAAAVWLEGANSDMTHKNFVEYYTVKKGIIPGIGHKKYRIGLPDPRVDALQKYAPSNGKYLEFALGIEQVTTSKKGNLILNVDGAIAAVMLDLLESELQYSKGQLEELVRVEFFNALFVLSRSVGFVAHYLDQKRNDEGLLRLGENDVAYFE
jgi:ATP citrate (pro-S)-lyase